MTNNKYVLSWIEEMAAITQPDKIVWIDGSEEQAEALRAEACSTGELEKLNEELRQLRESEMWQAGVTVRKLRPEND